MQKGLKHNALTYAVSRGEAEIAKILLENGANANDAEGSVSQLLWLYTMFCLSVCLNLSSLNNSNAF